VPCFANVLLRYRPNHSGCLEQDYVIDFNGLWVIVISEVFVCAHGVCLCIGSCTIGWAFWATVCGGTIMVVCSWLACYAGKRKGGYQRPAAPL